MKRLNSVIKYVQKNTRYIKNFDRPYTVRYPATASRPYFAKEPRDLVKQIMKDHFPKVDISKY